MDCRNFRVLGALPRLRAKQAWPLPLNLGFWRRELRVFFAFQPLCSDRGDRVFSRAVRGIVITGGAAPETRIVEPWLSSCDVIVAADSGLDTAHGYGVSPSIIVGDFDSLSSDSLLDRYPDADVRRHAPAKDETDTELALAAARETGSDEVILIGGGGGRLDHLIAIQALFERETYPSLWLTDRDAVRSVNDVVVERGRPGQLISFFPLGCETCTMVSLGLRWPLDELRWNRGDVGLSNEFTGTEVRVRMMTGRLLMVRPIVDAA